MNVGYGCNIFDMLKDASVVNENTEIVLKPPTPHLPESVLSFSDCHMV